MFCNKCGKDIPDSSLVCSYCGAQVGQRPVQSVQAVDGPIGGLGILCFLFPIVGLILYLVWKDSTPEKAKGAGKAALWGVGIGVGLYLLMIIVMVVAGAAAY